MYFNRIDECKIVCIGVSIPEKWIFLGGGGWTHRKIDEKNGSSDNTNSCILTNREIHILDDGDDEIA